jgi:hypothetical protein
MYTCELIKQILARCQLSYFRWYQRVIQFNVHLSSQLVWKEQDIKIKNHITCEHPLFNYSTIKHDTFGKKRIRSYSKLIRNYY